MEIRERLSLNMRRLRQSKGWSQEEFAHQASLHRTYVSDLERGARNPTIALRGRDIKFPALPIACQANIVGMGKQRPRPLSPESLCGDCRIRAVVFAGVSGRGCPEDITQQAASRVEDVVAIDMS